MSWKNGDNVERSLKNACSTDSVDTYCKKSDDKYISKPYGPPNCNQFAVLNKPDVNRWYFRGCEPDAINILLYNPKYHRTDADGHITSYLVDDFKKDYPNLICDLEGYCREGLEAFLFPNTSYLQSCANDAPGGLANSETDMDKYANQDYYRNGFIMDKCECQFDPKAIRGNNVSWYKSYYDTLVAENGLIYSDLWDGAITPYEENGEIKFPPVCETGRNLTIEQLQQEGKDSTENNCSQYLLKWAKTCDWCKKVSKGKGIKAPDTGLPCVPLEEDQKPEENPFPCYGDEDKDHCIKLFDIDIDGINADSIGVCAGSYNMDCNICNSELWNYVPGGIDALLDPEHRLHDIALLSYVPKSQEVSTVTSTCGQPEVKINGEFPSVTEKEEFGNLFNCDPKDIDDANQIYFGRDNLASTKKDTTFCNAGPFETYNSYVGFSGEKSIIFPPKRVASKKREDCAEQTWYNNSCNNLCCSGGSVTNAGCPKLDWNDVTNQGESVWDGRLLEDNNCARIGAMNDCKVDFTYNDFRIGRHIVNNGEPIYYPSDSSKTMCQRNPQLTGYGIYENNSEKPTQSNYHIAENWINGIVDLTDYGKGKIEPFTEEEISEHVTQALRCCAGLNPEYEKGDGNEPKDRKWCMPATTCPSSQFCKDLYTKAFKGELPGQNQLTLAKFGTPYPKGYDPEGIKITTPATSEPDSFTLEDLKEPAYYAKTYCQYAGAKKDGDCSYDEEIATLCRKGMYNYAVEPVTVTQKLGNEYDLETYDLPMRIFDETVYDWCNGENLSDALPDQKGVCDMLLGRTCQQLQVDGWINPNKWDDSPIIDAFTSDGEWVEKDTGIKHTLKRDRFSKISDTLLHTCSCFLLGSQCGDQHCSYFYCGAGMDGEVGPNKVSYDKLNTDTESTLNKKVDLSLYGKPNDVAPEWVSGIDSDFTCVASGQNAEYQAGESNCFSRCNYVNTYDTCWNAGPENRKINVPFEQNRWQCHKGSKGDSCKTEWNLTENFGDQGYGCYGFCSVYDQANFPNCGTESWFLGREYDDKPLQLTPYQKDGQPLNENQYSMWQNWYTQQLTDGGDARIISIPGWGSFSDNSAANPMCVSKDCQNSNSIHPYGPQRPCTNSCTITQSIVFNNQGNFSAEGVIMSNSSAKACTFIGDFSNTSFNSADANTRLTYVNYMGFNDCTDACKDYVYSDECQQCLDNTQICIDSKGNNCSECGGSSSNGAPKKNTVCCTSDTLVDKDSGIKSCYPYYEGDLDTCKEFETEETCSTRSDICQWTNRETYDNQLVLNNISNNVSYICQTSECPPGTVDQKDLELSCNGNKICSKRTDKADCDTCEYCQWFDGDSELSAGCYPALCPMPSGEVLVVPPGQITPPPETNAPVSTVAPTVAPTPEPSWVIPGIGVVGTVMIYVFIFIIAVVVGVLLYVYVLNPRNNNTIMKDLGIRRRRGYVLR